MHSVETFVASGGLSTTCFCSQALQEVKFVHACGFSCHQTRQVPPSGLCGRDSRLPAHTQQENHTLSHECALRLSPGSQVKGLCCYPLSSHPGGGWFLKRTSQRVVGQPQGVRKRRQAWGWSNAEGPLQTLEPGFSNLENTVTGSPKERSRKIP